MKHFLNRQRQRNVLGLNNPADVTMREVKRGDSGSFEVVVCDDFGSAVELDATLTLTDFRFTAKVVGALGAESAIVSATSYTKSGTGSSTVYTLSPALNGTALGDLFPTGGTQSTPANEAARLALIGLAVNAVVRQVDTGAYWMLTNAAAPSSAASWSLSEARANYVDLAGEFKYTLDGKEFSYPTFTYRVWDDVDKAGDTTSGALPVASAFVGLALTAFTGGGATALDGLDITGFPVGSIVEMVGPDGGLSAWRLTAPAAITANTVANPTVATSAAHGLPSGTTSIVVGGSNSTPTIDGARTATYVAANTFSLPVNVTVAGTSGYWSKAEDVAAGRVLPDTAYLGRYWTRISPTISARAICAADVTRNTFDDPALVDDTLSFPILANEKWQFEFTVFWTASTNAEGLGMGINYPASPTKFIAGDAGTGSAGSSIAATTTDLSSLPFGAAVGSAGVLRKTVISGSIINGSTAGNVALHWTLYDGSGTGTRKAGSYVDARRVP